MDDNKHEIEPLKVDNKIPKEKINKLFKGQKTIKKLPAERLTLGAIVGINGYRYHVVYQRDNPYRITLEEMGMIEEKTNTVPNGPKTPASVSLKTSE